MRQLTLDDYEKFVASKDVAAVHFDASWDVGHRPGVQRRMLEAHAAFGDRVSFAEVDIDAEVDLAKSLPIGNVPTVAYYVDGVLIAALIGANQNVKERVARLLRGESIGYKDGTDAA